MLMTGVLLGGLLLRQHHGPARIGYESILLLVIYAGAVAIQVVIGIS
jgi:cation:H+ antiporter